MSARRVVALLGALALLGGCSDGGGVSTEAASPSTTVAGAGDDFDAGEPEFEQALRSFYNEFNQAADAHRVPDDFIRQYGSGLEEMAEPAVVAYFDQWRATNDSYGESFPRAVRFVSGANILSIDVQATVVTIRDCTRETRTMVTGQEVPAYVTRTLTVSNHGGLYKVATLSVDHEGRFDSPGYGCIPHPMAEEAKEVARVVAEGFTAAQADPTKGLPAALDDVVADPLRQELAASLAEQAGQGLVIASPTDVSLRVLGLDPRGAGREVAVVTACIAYPEGLDLRDPSGRVTRQVFPPGTANKVDYAVRLDHVDGPAAHAVVREERAPSC